MQEAFTFSEPVKLRMTTTASSRWGSTVPSIQGSDGQSSDGFKNSERSSVHYVSASPPQSVSDDDGIALDISSGSNEDNSMMELEQAMAKERLLEA